MLSTLPAHKPLSQYRDPQQSPSTVQTSASLAHPADGPPQTPSSMQINRPQHSSSEPHRPLANSQPAEAPPQAFSTQVSRPQQSSSTEQYSSGPTQPACGPPQTPSRQVRLPQQSACSAQISSLFPHWALAVRLAAPVTPNAKAAPPSIFSTPRRDLAVANAFVNVSKRLVSKRVLRADVPHPNLSGRGWASLPPGATIHVNRYSHNSMNNHT